MVSSTLLIALLANIAIFAKAQSPLQGKSLYVNPVFRQRVDGTIAQLAADAPDHDITLQNLQLARDSSTVIWLNSPAQVQPNNTDAESMATVLTEASKQPGTTVVFAINNIPRGQCVQALETYKHSLIDSIVDQVNTHKASVFMAFIIEANAVANMVTNINNPVCEDAQTQISVHGQAISYAITELNKAAPEFPLYVGLGHSGWLGSETKSKAAADIINAWNVNDQFRGFATNIGNFKPVGTACPAPAFCVPGNNNEADPCCTNPCESQTDYHDNTEMNFALRMESLFPGKKVVIDTGKNGVSNSRTTCQNWCNIRNGLGLRPSGDTLSPLADAYLWIKPPGETNGCTEVLPTGDTCPSFQTACASVDSVGSAAGEPRMPVNGGWSDFYMTMLAREANFDNVVLPYTPPANTSVAASSVSDSGETSNAVNSIYSQFLESLFIFAFVSLAFV